MPDAGSELTVQVETDDPDLATRGNHRDECVPASDHSREEPLTSAGTSAVVLGGL